MHTTNFSKAIDKIIRWLGTGSVDRMTLRYDRDTETYYYFQKFVREESEFKAHHLGAVKMLDMNNMEMKVFIRRIKTIQGEMELNGTDKKDTEDREQSGGLSLGLDAGGTGVEDRESGDSAELHRPDDNDHTGDGGDDSGTESGQEPARRGVDEGTPEEKK